MHEYMYIKEEELKEKIVDFEMPIAGLKRELEELFDCPFEMKFEDNGFNKYIELKIKLSENWEGQGEINYIQTYSHDVIYITEVQMFVAIPI